MCGFDVQLLHFVISQHNLIEPHQKGKHKYTEFSGMIFIQINGQIKMSGHSCHWIYVVIYDRTKFGWGGGSGEQLLPQLHMQRLVSLSTPLNSLPCSYVEYHLWWKSSQCNFPVLIIGIWA